MSIIVPSILVLWMVGPIYGSNNDTEFADKRGGIAMQEFNNGSNCKVALAEIKRKSKETITGVCLPK